MSDGEYDERPWGSYQVLEEAASHKIKRMTVSPGQRLSYQRHQQRAEHWYIVSGQACVTLEDVEHIIGQGHAIDIPRGSAHRVANKTDELLVLCASLALTHDKDSVACGEEGEGNHDVRRRRECVAGG